MYSKTKYACYIGYISQSITVNLAPLLFVLFRKEYNLSLSYIALIPLITFLIQIGIDFLSIFFIEKVTYRLLSVSSQLASFAGLVLLSFLPEVISPKIAILLSILLYSAGSALSEIVLSPLIDSLPKNTEDSSAITFLHSFYSWGQAAVVLLTTLFLKILGTKLWYIIPLFWALVPLLNSILFSFVPLPEMKKPDKSHTTIDIIKKPTFIVLIILMVAAGASEQVMAQWTSMFAEIGLGVSKVVGDIVGPCMFAVSMGIGRVLHGIYGKKYDIKKLLLSLSVLTLICYLLTVFSPSPYISLISCALCGFGVSIMWPGEITVCSETFIGGGASMFVILALGGDIGCSVGPYLSGSISDIVSKSEFMQSFAQTLGLHPEQLGLRTGFLAASIFPLIMILGSIFQIKHRHKE